MPSLDLKRKAKRFIEFLPPKHKRQVKDCVLSLQDNPFPHDSRKLVGYENYIRVDIGEYRIIYRYEEEKDLVVVVLIGKRNDDEIYRITKRNLK